MFSCLCFIQPCFFILYYLSEQNEEMWRVRAFQASGSEGEQSGAVARVEGPQRCKKRCRNDVAWGVRPLAFYSL